MPHIVVKLYPGRSEREKAELAQELTVTMISVLGSRRDAISVGIEEVAPDDWTELVVKPDVLAKPGTIYKQPGT
jgi:4-oxalocrotonate tautomerase